MTCHSPQEVIELIGPAVFAALDAEEHAKLDRHLVDCADCRQELLSLRRVVAKLSALRQPEPPLETAGTSAAPATD
jgi:hypothetical protein